MNKLPIEPFGNTKADLLFWIKEYLASKMFTLKVDPSFSISFNRVANKERILSSQNDIELNEVSKAIRREGMKNFGIYFVSLLAFYRYVGDNEKIASIKQIDTAFRNLYFSSNPGKLKTGTLSSYLTQINSLFKFIDDNNVDLTTGDPHNFYLDKKKGGPKTAGPLPEDQKERQYLLPEEHEQFLRSVDTYPFRMENPAQMKLMMKLICFGGLRSEEVTTLTDSQLSFIDDPSVLLPRDKYLRIDVNRRNRKQRFVYIKASKIENDYLAWMKNRSCANAYLFCTASGERYSNRTPYDNVLRLMKHAHIDKSGLQTLRHSYATFLMSRNIDFATIIELFGQEIEEITELYLRVTKEGVRKIPKALDAI